MLPAGVVLSLGVGHVMGHSSEALIVQEMSQKSRPVMTFTVQVNFKHIILLSKKALKFRNPISIDF